MIRYLVEFFFVVGLFTNALLFIPQIIRLFKAKHANDVSLITFAGFNAINLFTVFHGIVQQDILLIIGFVFSLITNTIVTFLIIWYRFNPKKNEHKYHIINKPQNLDQ